MPINLSEPLRWTSADADETALLKDLQGNILDGHGRKATLHLMLRFGADAAAAQRCANEGSSSRLTIRSAKT